MIQVMAGAHLNERDRNEFNMWIQNLRYGNQGEDADELFVAPFRTDIVMMTGVWYGQKNSGFGSAPLDTWGQLMPDMPHNGLRHILPFIWDKVPKTELLILAYSGFVFVWSNRNSGVYLRRHKKIYRLHPTDWPIGIFPQYYLGSLECYAFRPRQDDALFLLPPERLFPYRSDENKELRQRLESQERIGAAISTVMFPRGRRGLAKDRDFSFMYMQFDDIQGPDFNREKSQFLDPYREAELRFYELLDQEVAESVFYPWLTCEDLDRELIDNKRKGMRVDREPVPLWADILQDAKVRQELLKKDKRPVIKASLNTLSQPKKTAPKLSTGNKLAEWNDRLMEVKLEGSRRGLTEFLKTLRSFLPRNSALSLVIIGVSLVMLVALLYGMSLLWKRAEAGKEDLPAPSQQADQTVPYQQGDPQAVVIPEKTPLEIVHTVKAVQLQILQAPKDNAPIIATLTRGDKLTQLTEPANGFVFVSLPDGQVGYVFANYLE